MSEEIITSILNLGELYLVLLREKGIKLAESWFNRLKYTTLSVDLDVIKKAMLFRFDHKGKNLSFIDCVGYVQAREHGLMFLTGDKEFRDVPSVRYVK